MLSTLQIRRFEMKYEGDGLDITERRKKEFNGLYYKTKDDNNGPSSGVHIKNIACDNRSFIQSITAIGTVHTSSKRF